MNEADQCKANLTPGAGQCATGRIVKPYGELTFGEALTALKCGRPIQRSSWNGQGQYLRLQVPDAHSKMTLPYIYIRTVQGDRVPWLASQTDILASDWRVVDGGY